MISRGVAKDEIEAVEVINQSKTLTKEQFLNSSMLALIRSPFPAEQEELNERLSSLGAWYDLTHHQEEEFPDPVTNKGRIIKSTTTGKRYRSNGEKWLPMVSVGEQK